MDPRGTAEGSLRSSLDVRSTDNAIYSSYHQYAIPTYHPVSIPCLITLCYHISFIDFRVVMKTI